MATSRQKPSLSERQSEFTSDQFIDFSEKWVRQLPLEDRADFLTHLMVLDKEHDRQIKALHKIMERVEAAVNKDPVTHLPNRRLTRNTLEDLIVGKGKQDTTAIGVIFVDMNDLKVVNDRLGHKVGDQALACVASIIEHSIKGRDSLERWGQPLAVASPSSDKPAGGRWGGDEFVVIVELRVITDFYKIVERLHVEIANPKQQAKCGYSHSNLSAAVGGVAYQFHPGIGAWDARRLADSLVDMADRRMYKCKKMYKEKGRGEVYIEYVRYNPAFKKLERFVPGNGR